MNFNNVDQFISMIKNGNPQAFVTNMVQQQANLGNPMMQSLLQKINAGDSQGIEQFARNIAKEKGIDFDKEFYSFKQRLGL